MRKAYYHLPGLFEFYELYKEFLPIFRDHREFFYDWCEIGSIYGSPMDCLWGGGRVELGETSPEKIIKLLEEFDISARLTLSNSLLTEEHLADKKCNTLCELFSKSGVIIYSELLHNYLKANFSDMYFISSTTKVLTDFEELLSEINREDFRFVVPDFRFNKAFDKLERLSEAQKAKVEFLCNECCSISCKDRKACYEEVSRKNLGAFALQEKKEGLPQKGYLFSADELPIKEHQCTATDSLEGYRFSKAMENPAFISIDDIQKIYLPMGFSNFKIEGRGLGSALVLEFLLYYMTKPECQLRVRELLYLDNMLDLF